MPRSRRSRYQQMAYSAAARYNVPPRLFLAMIDLESGWDPAAISSAGAVGLGQLMPGTARGLGVDPFKPKENLDGAARYLRDAIKHFGTYKDALRAYNTGWGGAEADPQNGLGYANAVLARRSKFAMPNGKVKNRPLRQSNFNSAMGSQRVDFQKLAGELFYDDPQFLQFVQSLKLGNRGATKIKTTGQPPVTEQIGNSVANLIVKTAEKEVGVKYAWGEESPKAGFDCSGLLWWAFKQHGISIPRRSQEQWKSGRTIARSALLPGDAVFFKGYTGGVGGPGHVAMYIGNGKMLVAPQTGDVVRIVPLNSHSGYMGARRFT